MQTEIVRDLRGIECSDGATFDALLEFDVEVEPAGGPDIVFSADIVSERLSSFVWYEDDTAEPVCSESLFQPRREELEERIFAEIRSQRLIELDEVLYQAQREAREMV